MQRVYTVTDYYNGVRRGVADYEGSPHYFESSMEDVASGGKLDESFRLTPISEDTFNLALEDWEIWRRWESAFHTGEASQDTHPALPEDSPRHLELVPVLEGRLKTDSDQCLWVTGCFTVDEERPMAQGMKNFMVKWELIYNER